MKQITPLFKENDEGQQYAYRSGKWHRTDESTIDVLWQKWVISPHAERYVDNEGFTVFGYKEVNND